MSEGIPLLLELRRIRAGDNDRKEFDRFALEELAASIHTNGLIQPITVRPVALVGETDHEIVAGERRTRALRILTEKVESGEWAPSPKIQAGFAPVLVKELTDEETAAVMLVENTGRVDLNPIEEAEGYNVRKERFGWTDERIAEVAGKSVEIVKRRLRLLQLVPEIQHLVKHSNFPIGHAELLADLDPNRQRLAVQVYRKSKGGVPFSDFKHIVGTFLAEQSQESLFDLADFWGKQVEADKPLPQRGKFARTGAPVRQDLPPVIQSSPKDSTAMVMDRWIAELVKAGKMEEAQVAGTLYQSLVVLNFLAVPPDSELQKLEAA